MPAALWVALGIAVFSPLASSWLVLRVERKKAAEARRAEVYVKVLTFAATWHQAFYRAIEAQGKDKEVLERAATSMKSLLSDPDSGGPSRFVVHRAQLLAVGSRVVLAAFDEFEERLSPTTKVPFAMATLTMLDGAWDGLVKAIQAELSPPGGRL